MKFQTTPNKIKGEWLYQAQFHDPKAMKRAMEWLASRSSTDTLAEQASIYTNDLQVIFEIRVHFDPFLKVIKAAKVQQP